MTPKKKDLDTVPILVPATYQEEPGEYHGAAQETAKEQALWGSSKVKEVKLDKEDYQRICTQVFALVDAQEKVTPKSADGFRVDEVTVSLGVHASGGLAFIAEAGVEASIEVTFKRGG